MEHTHSFSVHTSCECGVMLSDYTRSLRVSNTALVNALQLPLLFHGADWDEDKRAIWKSITGHSEATTKIMCDHIRAAIQKAEAK